MKHKNSKKLDDKTKKTKEQIEKDEYENTILRKIKKNLAIKKNELEIIDSQIYAINKIVDDEYELEIIKEERKEISVLMKQIEEIKEQIKIYENDDVLDDALSLDDRDVVDDLSDYKKFIDKHISFKDEYSKLVDYAFITEEIQKINYRCIMLEQKKQAQLDRLNITEEQLKQYQLQLMSEEDMFSVAQRMTQESEEILSSLDAKIEDIESNTVKEYDYSGLTELVSLELKYLMLLGLSPLKGALPVIAISTANTIEMLRLLSSKKLIKVREKVEYFTTDYQELIKNSIAKLDNIDDMLSFSLSSLASIKEKFVVGYMADNPKCRDFVEKINAMEGMIKDNLIKISIYKTRMENNRDKNSDKLTRVLKMNEEG